MEYDENTTAMFSNLPPAPPELRPALAVTFGGVVLARAVPVSPEGATPETWEFCVEGAAESLTVARGRMIAGFLGELIRFLPQPVDGKRFDLEGHLERQRRFSERAFGPGERVAGVLDHMGKELQEVALACAKGEPTLPEWIDLVILALDGAWRSGASPRQIIAAMVAKQDKNESRSWPNWRTADPDKAIEHDRSADAQPHTCECGDCDLK